MTQPSPCLTDAEIDEICKPLKAGYAQRRFLANKLGLLVKPKPNGKPLVARSEFERVMGAQRLVESEAARQGPNIAAARERWCNRSNHGAQAQKR